MTVTTITPGDRLAILGLLTMAAQHHRAVVSILHAVQLITGDRHDGGHSADAVHEAGFGGHEDLTHEVDELLRKLGITVQ